MSTKIDRSWMARARGWAFGLASLALLPMTAMAQDAAPAAPPADAAAAAPAAQQAVEGLHGWQVYFQPAGSPIMHQIEDFNAWLMIVLALILLFVIVLLGWCILRFNARAHPVPTKTSHNSVIEVLWTVVPVLILVAIAIPSFSLLFAQYDPARVIANYDPAKAVTIKATGNQWAWQYDYPDNGGISLYSSVVRDDQGLPAGNPRLLQADYPMVVPVNTVIRLQTTSDPDGVLHSFALPAFGMKVDAVPGRITEMWFQAEREGTYYGQCSELCGKDHYAMPIEVRVVSPEKFQQWAETAVTDPDAGNALLAQWEDQRRSANRLAQN